MSFSKTEISLSSWFLTQGCEGDSNTVFSTALQEKSVNSQKEERKLKARHEKGLSWIFQAFAYIFCPIF